MSSPANASTVDISVPRQPRTTSAGRMATVAGELGTDVVRPWPLPCLDASRRHVMPAPYPRCGSAAVPARRARRYAGLAGAVRVGVLAAIALFLAGCSIGVNCKPCGGPVQVGIFGVGHDPPREVLVCVDGAESCVQLRIRPSPDSSTSPGALQRYPCTKSDPAIGCFVEGSTAYVDFPRLVPKDLPVPTTEGPLWLRSGGRSGALAGVLVAARQSSMDSHCECPQGVASASVGESRAARRAG
jgi:hypothetical protein